MLVELFLFKKFIHKINLGLFKLHCALSSFILCVLNFYNLSFLFLTNVIVNTIPYTLVVNSSTDLDLLIYLHISTQTGNALVCFSWAKNNITQLLQEA